MGVKIVSEDEATQLARGQSDLLLMELRDFDYGLIARVFGQFGLTLAVDGVAVAVFDHGAAPPDVSDRQFRFDYLDDRIRALNRLSAFAFPAASVPAKMTRLRAVADIARATGMPGHLPLMLMDTAPAAVLGATLDPHVDGRDPVIIANVGNFHALAFRLQRGGVGGVFEHHTGFLNTTKLERLINSLAASTLRHEDVFGDEGHGALVYDDEPALLDMVAVTGPRRSMMARSSLPVYFAAPYGDMMMTGCFGLVRAWADLFPDDRELIQASLAGVERGAPWDVLEEDRDGGY
jgi:uncharacterized protein (DUF1786 family)